MNRFFLLVGLWLLVSSTFAQKPPASPATQRLWQALRRHPQEDTFRVNRLNQLADLAMGEGQVSPTQRDSLARQASRLAQGLNYAYGQGYALYNLATNTGPAWRQQRRALLLQALPLAERSGNKPLLIKVLKELCLLSGRQGLAYIQRAIALASTLENPVLLKQCYYEQADYFKTVVGNYYLALQSMFQTLRVAQQAHLAVEEAHALGDLGLLYIDLGDYDQALAYLRRMLTKAETLRDPEQVAALQGGALYGLGECYRITGRYAPAAAAYRRSLHLTTSVFGRMVIKSGLADTYERQGRPQALPYAREVLAETRQAQNNEQRFAYMRTCLTLGRYFLRTGPADSALRYGRQALQLTHYITLKEPTRDALQLLAQAYAQRKQFAQAYAYQRRYLDLKDTLNNEQVTRQSTAARFTQDLARQKSQIALLTKTQQLQNGAANRQRLLLAATLAVLSLIGSLLFVLARNNQQKQRANTLLLRQKGQIQAQRDQTDHALTELKATQKRLIQSEKMASLGELTAGIAHEIQNPLNFVNNFSEVSTELVAELREEQAKGAVADAGVQIELLENLAQNLAKITRHGQRASDIVRGMLEHSRASTCPRQPVDLNALADEYLRLAYHGLRAKDNSFIVELKTDFAPALPAVEAIGPDLGRVLLNLFSNAFYAVQQRQKSGETGYSPAVEVSTHRAGQRVEIRIRDNGTGMPETVKEKVFQPFFTTKPPGEGTGLGLSLAYDIITKEHGGTLAVDSRKGEFTEFAMGLPASAANGDA